MVKQAKHINIFDSVFRVDEQIKLIDVRSPAEFAKGHIPGAKNIPLLNNEERVEVGTLYKQESPEVAFNRGLEIVVIQCLGYLIQRD